MSTKERKRGLGRGLSALMADVTEAEQAAATRTGGEQRIPIERIRPNPEQPRKAFTQSDLDDLAASIREKGIIQPLIVRRMGDGDYEIVAGERRWRAAQQVQLHDVPAIVRDFDDLEVLEIAIIENVQRADLNPVEEASGYRQLMDRFGHTQEKLAEALGKSRSHIANLLRLLTLPPDVLHMLEKGDLSAGHARALVTAENPLELAKTVIRKGLSVRETEALVKKAQKGGEPQKPPRPQSTEKDADTRALEADLSAATGMKISIAHKPGEDGGALTLHYTSLEQLDDICRKLSAG